MALFRSTKPAGLGKEGAILCRKIQFKMEKNIDSAGWWRCEFLATPRISGLDALFYQNLKQLCQKIEASLLQINLQEK